MAKNQKGISHIFIIVGLAILAVGAMGSWVYHTNQDNKKLKNTVGAYDQSLINPPRITNFFSGTKTYTSKALGVSFKYPPDWTITDKGNGALIAKSPLVFNGNINEVIALTVRDKKQNLSEFGRGDATVKSNSVKIGYTNPAKGQRPNTYLTFVSYPGINKYDTSVLPNHFEAIYVTGATAYKVGQKISANDVKKVDPVIRISFEWDDGAPIDLLTDTLQQRDFLDPLKDIISSFVIN